MKKSTLALVVMGIVASVSVQAAEIYNKDGNKLDVYGKVKAMHYMSDNDSKDGDQSYIRFGFKGETQINDQLTGYGRWEAEFAGNKAESDTAQQKTRLAFAGLKYKDLGSFDYGRNLGALYDVEAWTDMFPEFGGDSSAQTDNFMTKRASGLATYRNTDFFGVIDGLNLTLQYQGKNENRDVKKQNGDGFGTSLTYDFGLRPSLGYVLSKGKDIEGIGDEDLVNYVDVGATYYFNKNMSAFVDYKINQLDSDNKLNINNDDIVAVGMTYQF
ncbi:porin [Escherichia coli]